TSQCQRGATRARVVAAKIACHVADPRHIVARASRGEHGRSETPAQCGGVEEDRGFGAATRNLVILSIKTHRISIQRASRSRAKKRRKQKEKSGSRKCPGRDSLFRCGRSCPVLSLRWLRPTCGHYYW